MMTKRNLEYMLLHGVCAYSVACCLLFSVRIRTRVIDTDPPIDEKRQENIGWKAQEKVQGTHRVCLLREIDSLEKLLEADRILIFQLKERKHETMEQLDDRNGGELLRFFAKLKTDRPKSER